MKLLTLMVLMAVGLVAKDRYKICVASEVGQGCSRETFDKKTVFKLRDIFAQAPIPADYSVWVENAKTKESVRGPNDPPTPIVPTPVPTELPKSNGPNI